MDKMLYLSMTSASNGLLGQATVANNLANANTPGFKADLEQFRSMPVFGDGLPSRAYALQERPTADFSEGGVRRTGNPMDFAINGDGWIAVLAEDGTEAYTRRGDLQVNSLGIITNGSGHVVLGNGGPIALPPVEKLEIGVDGTISMRPVGQDERSITVVDRVKLVNPPATQLYKGADGLFRMKDGSQAEIDASIRLIPESQEQSNVNIVASMVQMIELARRYEMDIKAMESAKQNDEVGTCVLSMT